MPRSKRDQYPHRKQTTGTLAHIPKAANIFLRSVKKRGHRREDPGGDWGCAHQPLCQTRLPSLARLHALSGRTLRTRYCRTPRQSAVAVPFALNSPSSRSADGVTSCRRESCRARTPTQQALPVQCALVLTGARAKRCTDALSQRVKMQRTRALRAKTRASGFPQQSSRPNASVARSLPRTPSRRMKPWEFRQDDHAGASATGGDRGLAITQCTSLLTG